MRVSLILAFVAFPAVAQELPFSPAATEACLAMAESPGARLDCVGASAEACRSRDGISSEFAIAVCYGAEADYWEARLNTAYRTLMALEYGATEERRTAGILAPDTALALQDMQRAWSPYRDAACWYEFATFGGEPGGGPANARCLMQVTARQAMALEAQLEGRAE